MRLIALLLCWLAACQPQPTLLPFNATVPVQVTALDTEVRIVNTRVPTADPLPSRTATPSLTPTLILTDTPAPTSTPSLTLTPSLVPTSTFIPVPVGGLAIAGMPTWTPPPPNVTAQIADHYVFGRPIDADHVSWAARTYPYGGTQNGRLQVHHGIDLVNPTGVSILAAADGTVIYAGDDLSQQFGSMNNYYGNLVVLQHNFRSPQGEPVFTLYGHLLAPTVQVGQEVREGDKIGVVGATGVAQGPHLHFEVRVGDPYSFDATRNPDLWLRPYPGYGTLVGRVTDADGTPLYAVTLEVKSADIARETYSYGDGSVNPDTAFGENFTLGDLPANYYTITVRDDEHVRFQRLIYVYPNRSTWLDVVLSP